MSVWAHICEAGAGDICVSSACVSRHTHEHEHQSRGHYHGLRHPSQWALPAKAVKLGISGILQGLEPGWEGAWPFLFL